MIIKIDRFRKKIKVLCERQNTLERCFGTTYREYWCPRCCEEFWHAELNNTGYCRCPKFTEKNITSIESEYEDEQPLEEFVKKGYKIIYED